MFELLFCSYTSMLTFKMKLRHFTAAFEFYILLNNFVCLCNQARLANRGQAVKAIIPKVVISDWSIVTAVVPYQYHWHYFALLRALKNVAYNYIVPVQDDRGYY